MPNKVIVTAVIRTYKRPNLVRRAIESVLNQTFKDFELIVLDDCSPDNTPEIIQRYVNIDHRIRYIRHEVNKGTGASFNTGNRSARGKYIAYLDDDDVWLPKKLDLQVAKMEEIGGEYGLITGGVRHIDMNTGKIIRIFRPHHEGNIYWDLLKLGSRIIGPPSVVMLRTSAIEKLGEFAEDLPRGCGQDYFRYLAKNYKIIYVEDICLDYYIHEDRITTHNSQEDVRNDIISREYKLSRFGDDLRRIPEAYARELVILGDLYLCNGEINKGRSYFFKAMQVNGLSPKLIFRIALSFLGKSVCGYFFTPGFRFALRLQVLKSKLWR